MAECLCCLARTTKVLCSNLGATRYRMTLDKSLMTVCFGSLRQCILITCDIHPPVLVASQYGWGAQVIEKRNSALRQAGLLFRVTASNSCRKTIGLSKLSLDRTLYRKVAKRHGILSRFLSLNCFFIFISR